MKNKLIDIMNKKGKLYVSSRTIASELGKRHDNIMRDLENIIKNFHSSNLRCEKIEDYFLKMKYKSENGQFYEEYLLTKNGFILYVFNIQGYNDFKISYINEFDRMQERLKRIEENKNNTNWVNLRKQEKRDRKKLTDIIKETLNFYNVKQGYWYSNYTRLIYKIMGLKVDLQGKTKDIIGEKELYIENELQDKLKDLLLLGMIKKTDFKELYSSCKRELQDYYNHLIKELVTS